jgi:hypothetical protein
VVLLTKPIGKVYFVCMMSLRLYGVVSFSGSLILHVKGLGSRDVYARCVYCMVLCESFGRLGRYFKYCFGSSFCVHTRGEVKNA